MRVTPDRGFTLNNYSTDGVVSDCCGSYLMVLLGCATDKAIWRVLQFHPPLVRCSCPVAMPVKELMAGSMLSPANDMALRN